MRFLKQPVQAAASPLTPLGRSPGALRVPTSDDVARVHASHGDFVWAALQRLGVRDSDLEDNFQEVFCVVHQRLASFEGNSALVTAAAVALWGFAFGAFPVGFQTWIVRAAPDQAEGAGGLLVAAFQIAIASGAIGGGLLVDRIGALGGPAFAVAALAMGTLLTLRYGPRPARA